MTLPVALVTGAGSGIGRQAALQFAAAGHRVALVGRDPAKLARTIADIVAGQASAANSKDPSSPAPATLALPGDITDPAFCRRAVEQTLAAFGRLDVLANIAGQAAVLRIDQITPENLRQTLDTNLTATILLTAAAWPVFKRQGNGFVVNVSSMASVDPFPGFASYAAAKVAVNMFTRCAAAEGKPLGIQAVCVAPGAVETPMLRSVFDEKAIPRSRTLDPAEVAQVIVGCALGRRPFKPGETILLPNP